jgi:Uma2 family endonuclease
VGIRSPRAGRWDTVRIPDVVVIPLEQWRELQHREAIIELNEPPPLLVVESESTKRTDYRAKRSEYSVLDIPEYWIVDPLEAKVTRFTLVEGWYDPTDYRESDRIQSPLFPNLALTAQQVLNGNVKN